MWTLRVPGSQLAWSKIGPGPNSMFLVRCPLNNQYLITSIDTKSNLSKLTSHLATCFILAQAVGSTSCDFWEALFALDDLCRHKMTLKLLSFALCLHAAGALKVVSLIDRPCSNGGHTLT